MAEAEPGAERARTVSPLDFDSPDRTATATAIASDEPTSVQSPPPLPPPFFNPPPAFPESPVAAISPPTGPVAISGMSSSSSIASALALPSPSAGPDFAEIRPKLQALQRVSSESLTPRSSQSSTSIVSTGSEGGEHLVEMRERLFSEVSESASSSRRDDIQADELEINVINPTPPLRPLSEEALEEMKMRPRSGSFGSVEEIAHAWDSVWPTPNAAHRVNLPPEASSSKFPLAPIVTADLDKSPKRIAECDDVHSPPTPGPSVEPDVARFRKSPRRSPSSLPVMSPLNTNVNAATFDLDDDDEPSHYEHASMPEDSPATWAPSDTADIFPTNVEVGMDVTFDDEGLNTLERIFLLSRSDYAFHRAYVARVLGDLLVDVDPCESVEYVLPLVSGFSMDEDDSVKEAFAAELHRILWYFYSTCRLAINDVPLDDLDEQPAEVVTITSEGLEVVPKPTVAEIANAPVVAGRRKSVVSLGPSSAGPSSAGSALTRNASESRDDTPSSVSTSATAFSPGNFVNPFAPDDGDKGYTKDAGPLVEQPVIAVDFFRPLLGTMLLSDNPAIADPVRTGIIALIGRLRNQTPLLVETWGANATRAEPDERRLFISQTGNHSHDLRPFSRAARELVEHELLQGIVLGMGKLEVDVPDALCSLSLESGQWKPFPEDAGAEQTEQQMFHAQMVHEARVGRALSLSFIGSIAEYYEPHEIVDWGFVDEVLRGWDGDDTTRAEAALAMSLIAKKAPVEHVDRMIPLFEAFASDDTDHVRQSACLALPSLARRIASHDERRNFVVSAVQTLAASADDVKSALLEMLGEVIHAFVDDPRGPPIETLSVYLDDRPAGPPDSDWDVIASFNFPGVCLTLGPDRWHELRPLFNRLLERAGARVLNTVSAFIHELARILRPDQIVQDVVPVVRRCLSLSDDMRERAMEHIDVIVTSIGRDDGWAMFKELEQRWRDGSLGGWRVRERLALHIPAFLEAFAADSDKASTASTPQSLPSPGADTDTPRPAGGDVTPVPPSTASKAETASRLDTMLELMRSALLDPFAAVRDAATNAVPRSYEILADGSRGAEKFKDIMLDLALSEKFRHRLVFVRCLREFVKPPPNRDAFEEFFVPALPRLTNDVVDVRLGLAQAIANLFVIGAFYSDRQVPVPDEIRRLSAILADDDAPDVRQTVRDIDLGRFVKGKDSVEIGAAALAAEQAQRASLEQQTHSVREDQSEDVTPSASFAGRLAGADSRAHSPFASFKFPPSSTPDAPRANPVSPTSPMASASASTSSVRGAMGGPLAPSAVARTPSAERIAEIVPYHAAPRPTPERHVTPGSLVEHAHSHVAARAGTQTAQSGFDSERPQTCPTDAGGYGWEPRDASRTEWDPPGTQASASRRPGPDASASPPPTRRGQSGEGKQDLWNRAHEHRPRSGPEEGGLGGDAGGRRGGTRASAAEVDSARELAQAHAQQRGTARGPNATGHAADDNDDETPAPARASVDSCRSDDSRASERERTGAERRASVGPERGDPFDASFARAGR
ncbi:hypothetical protein Q5752_001237 [Cryptotrichosporon argae]